MKKFNPIGYAPRRKYLVSIPSTETEEVSVARFNAWQQEATERACSGCEGPQEGSSGCGIFSEYTPEWAICRGGNGHHETSL